MKVNKALLIETIERVDKKLLVIQTKHIGDLICSDVGRKDYLEGIWGLLHSIMDCEE